MPGARQETQVTGPCRHQAGKTQDRNRGLLTAQAPAEACNQISNAKARRQGPAHRKPIGCAGSLAIGQRAQDLVGDVDPGTGIDRFLQNEVVFLLFGNLANDAIGSLNDLPEFFVATLVQIFAKLPLLALKILVHLAEFALSATSLRLSHDRCVTLKALSERLDSSRQILQFLFASAELTFKFLLRSLGWHRFTQNAFGTDEADFCTVLGDGQRAQHE